MSSGQTVKEVSVELGVRSGTLRRWMNEYDEYGESAFPGYGSALFNSDYEIRKLKKANADLTMELEKVISIIQIKHAFLYLSVFIDIFTRKVVGWSMDTRKKDDLAIAALYQAVQRERPEAGLVVHTDCGAQYTSKRFSALLDKLQFNQSMSRKGNPYDNAVMESFYQTLKRELVQDFKFENPEQARLEIFKYIETYYNTKRMYFTLDYLSPLEFEMQSP